MIFYLFFSQDLWKINFQDLLRICHCLKTNINSLHSLLNSTTHRFLDFPRSDQINFLIAIDWVQTNLNLIFLPHHTLHRLCQRKVGTLRLNRSFPDLIKYYNFSSKI